MLIKAPQLLCCAYIAQRDFQLLIRSCVPGQTVARAWSCSRVSLVLLLFRFRVTLPPLATLSPWLTPAELDSLRLVWVLSSSHLTTDGHSVLHGVKPYLGTTNRFQCYKSDSFSINSLVLSSFTRGLVCMSHVLVFVKDAHIYIFKCINIHIQYISTVFCVQ